MNDVTISIPPQANNVLVWKPRADPKAPTLGPVPPVTNAGAEADLEASISMLALAGGLTPFLLIALFLGVEASQGLGWAAITTGMGAVGLLLVKALVLRSLAGVAERQRARYAEFQREVGELHQLIEEPQQVG
jgi:hypothetical protein